MRMSRRLAVRAMTEDQGTAQMTGPHPDIWAKFKPQLKARFCRHEPPRIEGRSTTPNIMFVR